jgi:23S rRNA (cytidine1920-2'-O)/16S rRNA (cytidine1409-2'-O)-methyltransferase
MPRSRPRFVPLLTKLEREHPELVDPVAVVAAGRVIVRGRVLTNPRARVAAGESLTVVTAPTLLRGTIKLRGAFESFVVQAAGKVALDLGASAGGFTRALLDAGVARVYAVDAGFGQMIGSLRSDPRVVNLERTNLAELGPALVPDEVALMTMDLSYLSIARALGQTDQLYWASRAELIALVKPMYELGLARPPSDEQTLAGAVHSAAQAATAHGWTVLETMRSPITGSRGAIEFFLHACRGEQGGRLAPRPF